MYDSKTFSKGFYLFDDYNGDNNPDNRNYFDCLSMTGSSVRNIPAFQVLQNVFVRSGTAALSSIILDAISTIFHSDPANYFILEPQNTLNQFSEKIHLKSPEVQVSIY